MQTCKRDPRQGRCRRAADARRRRRAVRVPRPARAGPGRRRRLPPAAPRAVPHLQHRPQHQLHQRLRGRLRLLRLLPQERRRRRLRPAARGALPEDRGDDRPGRRPDPAAGRQSPVAEAGMVRGAAPRPARPAIPQVNLHAFSAAGDLALPQAQQAAAARGAAAAQGGRHGQPARRRGRDPRRSRPQGDHRQQGADRGMARSASRLARSSAADRPAR